jgi:polyisoprenoid-binding protein YceI
MRKIIIATALATLLVASTSLAEEFILESGDEGNLVTFFSKAPMESFEGKTDQISGSINVELANLSASAQIEVRVDLSSLDTGMQLRNKHMCENHLETDKFPEAIFRAERLLKAPIQPLIAGGNAEFLLAGTMSLHGVTRELQVPVSVSCRELDGRLKLDVVTEFEITLSDYEIKRPKFLVLKLNETQRVEIRLSAWEVGT